MLKVLFSNLYEKKIDKEGMEETITTFMGNTTTPTISAAQKDKCEGVVVESELLYALKQMKNGSAPGCDGITVEFLKMFWTRISKLLALSFNSAFENGNLFSSQRIAVITLIHKGKDLARDNLKSLISLTNSDYKLLAKCLALRLGDVINDVSGDQVGCIKGRSVSLLQRPSTLTLVLIRRWTHLIPPLTPHSPFVPATSCPDPNIDPQVDQAYFAPHPPRLPMVLTMIYPKQAYFIDCP